MDSEAGNTGTFYLKNGGVIIIPEFIERGSCNNNSRYDYKRSGKMICNIVNDRNKININEISNAKKIIKYDDGSFTTLSPENDIIYELTNNRLLIIQSYKSKQIIKLDKSQAEAIKRIENCFFGNINPICCYPTGTGKTFIACEIMRWFWNKKLKNILLLVKAGNLEDPWKKTLGSFGIPFCILHGPERKNDYLIDNNYQAGCSVMLTSYDTWLWDNEYYNSKDEYDLIVFDELHTIINPKK
jgi:superfamily II DNA or RNA helicase